MMKFQRMLRMAAAAFVAIVWLAVPPVAYADQPDQGGGPSTISLAPTSERAADGNTFIDYTFVEHMLGILDGTRVGSGSLVIHPDGSVNTTNSGTFTGTIAGASGTAAMRFSGSGTFASAAGHFTIGDGTGGLAGVHGEGISLGSATGPTTLAGTYTAKVHFSGH